MAEGLRKLVGDKLQGKDGDVDTTAFKEKYVGLYFSAHWCPPCRGFTPKLVEWYNTFKSSANKDKMEMIFVSSDRDEAAFNEYYAEMPWHALPFSDRDRKVSTLYIMYVHLFFILWCYRQRKLYLMISCVVVINIYHTGIKESTILNMIKIFIQIN